MRKKGWRITLLVISRTLEYLAKKEKGEGRALAEAFINPVRNVAISAKSKEEARKRLSLFEEVLEELSNPENRGFVDYPKTWDKIREEYYAALR